MDPLSIVIRVTQPKIGKVSSFCTQPFTPEVSARIFTKIVAQLCEGFRMERKELDNFYGGVELRIPGNDDIVVTVERVPEYVLPSSECVVDKLVGLFPFTFTPA